MTDRDVSSQLADALAGAERTLVETLVEAARLEEQRHETKAGEPLVSLGLYDGDDLLIAVTIPADLAPGDGPEWMAKGRYEAQRAILSRALARLIILAGAHDATAEAAKELAEESGDV